MKKVAVIICAAGVGKRFGGKTKKTFVEVDRRPAFLRSVDAFSEREDVKQIIVAISPEDDEKVRVNFEATLSFMGVKLCLGGKERYETVSNALKLVKDDIELVAVHDAVRCCLKKEWIDELFKTAGQTGAAMLACPVTATIKKVADSIITETVDRSDLYEAQTPQVFSAKLLKEAYEKLDDAEKSSVTDDAMLVEKLGAKVSIVETDSSNVKITTQADLAIAEAILRLRGKAKQKRSLGAFEEAQW